MSKIEIKYDQNVVDLATIGYLLLANLKCLPKNLALWQDIQRLADVYRKEYANPSEALDKLKPARDLYRAIGIEPTRIRPSSEALFRRVVKGKPLYQINSIVDLCNFTSLQFFLPIGLYDVEKISGNIILRKGDQHESYQGIGKDLVNVYNRLTLVDDYGPFGNPSADSLRTAISLDSHSVLMILFAPNNFSKKVLNMHLEFAGNMMIKYHPGGKILQSSIL
jgi:DNA/RNA-binding domain of Phe-tRNA-synthetase-like protein